MAKQLFTLWDAVSLTKDDAFAEEGGPTGVTANGTYYLAISNTINNSVGLQSLKLILRYEDIVPDFGNNPQTFDLDAVVEARNTGLLAPSSQWYPVAYQFSPFRATFQGTERIIQLQPSIAGFDAGVDDIIYVGDATRARVSRQQGNLPDTEFRVIILLTERGYGGAGSFQSVTISGFGAAFDA